MTLKEIRFKVEKINKNNSLPNKNEKKEMFKSQTNLIGQKASDDFLKVKDNTESSLIIILNNFKININHIYYLKLIIIIFISLIWERDI